MIGSRHIRFHANRTGSVGSGINDIRTTETAPRAEGERLDTIFKSQRGARLVREYHKSLGEDAKSE